jgi:hypothetical protein
MSNDIVVYKGAHCAVEYGPWERKWRWSTLSFELRRKVQYWGLDFSMDDGFEYEWRDNV